MQKLNEVATPRAEIQQILIVEDDPGVVESVREALDDLHYVVVSVADGGAALRLIDAGHFALLIVDRMLPSLNGLKVVELLRQRNHRTPVLFLTALGGLDDRVQGLEAGGDDYLVKPFEPAELVARVRALIRRSQQVGKPTMLQVADLEMDLVERSVRRGGLPVVLQAREFDLLAFLVEQRNVILSRSMLLERVWGFHFNPRTTIVETHISRLRAKIDTSSVAPLIHTIRGRGYTLSEDPDALA